MFERRYNEYRAREEAAKMQEKLASGEAVDYNEAEKEVEDDERLKEGLSEFNHGLRQNFLLAKHAQRKFGLSPEQIQPELLQYLRYRIQDRDYQKARRLKKSFSVSDSEYHETAKKAIDDQYYHDLKELEEIKTACQNLALPVEATNDIALIEHSKFLFSQAWIDGAEKLEKDFSLSPADVRYSVSQAFKKRLSNPDDYYGDWLKKAQTIRAHYGLTEEEVEPLAIDAVRDCLEKNQYFAAKKIVDTYKVPVSSITSFVQERVKYLITNNYDNNYSELSDNFPISKDFLTSPAIAEMGEKSVLHSLEEGDLWGAKRKIERHSLSQNFLQSPEAQKVFFSWFTSKLRSTDIDTIYRLGDDLPLPPDYKIKPEFAEAVKEGLIINIQNGYLHNIETILKFSNLPADFFGTPEVMSAAEKGYAVWLQNGNLEQNTKFKNFTGLTNEKASEIAGSQLLDKLQAGEAQIAEILINLRNELGDNTTQPAEIEAAKNGLVKLFREKKIDTAVKLVSLGLIDQESIQTTARQALYKNLEADDYSLAVGIKDKFSISSRDFTQELDRKLSSGVNSACLESLGAMPKSCLEPIEDKYHLLSYSHDLNLPSPNIYDQYRQLKDSQDEIQLRGYIEKIRQQVENLVSGKRQEQTITQEANYQDLITAVYPNHSNRRTNYDSNESCPDRSQDLDGFKVRDIYTIDLSEGVEMELKPGEKKDEKAISELESPITKIQQKFSQVGFEKDKMFAILDQEIEGKALNLPNREVYKTREEKLYGLLLESLVGRTNPDELKELLIGYQFAEFEDIKTYLEGTRAQADKAKNPDYAYLLQLREFFADRLKEVERKIAREAQENPEIARLLPKYYQAKRAQETERSRADQLNRLQISKAGLDGNLAERVVKELGRATDKKGNTLSLYSRDSNGRLVLGERGKSIVGMIGAERKKAAKTIQALTGKEVDPQSIHLGELNLKELLEAGQQMTEGKFDEELFSRYVLQAFQGVFEKELTVIDKETAKYQPKEEQLKGKKQKKLECFITKNHTSAHARGVGGVCVSGDNPGKYGQESIWNLPNYFQMVLRDADTKICQGLVLLHYYEDQGKKILTGSFNPSSTYLYSVNEEQLYRGLLKQLEVFATDNGIDEIAVSQNKTMRTNRTGGEFERAMDGQIKRVDKMYSLSETQIFSYHPKYEQKDLDVVWEKQ